MSHDQPLAPLAPLASTHWNFLSRDYDYNTLMNFRTCWTGITGTGCSRKEDCAAGLAAHSGTARPAAGLAAYAFGQVVEAQVALEVSNPWESTSYIHWYAAVLTAIFKTTIS